MVSFIPTTLVAPTTVRLVATDGFFESVEHFVSRGHAGIQEEHLIAGAIALGGPIGFIALVAPQIARRLWAIPGAALWQSLLLGAVLLAWADYWARHLFAPVQLPVGLVTGALGGAYLLWLLARPYR